MWIKYLKIYIRFSISGILGLRFRILINKLNCLNNPRISPQIILLYLLALGLVFIVASGNNNLYGRA